MISILGLWWRAWLATAPYITYYVFTQMKLLLMLSLTCKCSRCSNLSIATSYFFSNLFAGYFEFATTSGQ